MKVALVDKYDKSINYSSIFPDINLDIYHLSTSNKKRLLKADKDIEIDTEDYDYVILVGSDATKHFTTATVSSHQGYLVDDKYLPIIDPIMLSFKPSMKNSFDKAKENILHYIKGTMQDRIKREAVGIESFEKAYEVLKDFADAEPTDVAIDTETSALYPRDGILLGVSISKDISKGYYISSEVLDEAAEELLQKIINKHHIVFQNAKFDMSWLAYHLSLDFKLNNIKDISWFDDTMLMHYALDETTGTHGLKDNCIKYTDLGDYDKDLELFKRQYCRQHKIRLSDFTYDLIPFN